MLGILLLRDYQVLPAVRSVTLNKGRVCENDTLKRSQTKPVLISRAVPDSYNTVPCHWCDSQPSRTSLQSLFWIQPNGGPYPANLLWFGLSLGSASPEEDPLCLLGRNVDVLVIILTLLSSPHSKWKFKIPSGVELHVPRDGCPLND